jgi:hypothetical protein
MLDGSLRACQEAFRIPHMRADAYIRSCVDVQVGLLVLEGFVTEGSADESEWAADSASEGDGDFTAPSQPLMATARTVAVRQTAASSAFAASTRFVSFEAICSVRLSCHMNMFSFGSSSKRKPSASIQ